MAKEYEVLSCTETTRPGEEGKFEKSLRVKIKTAKGIIRSLEVPEKEFTEEKMTPKLLKLAQETDKIMGL